jgi:hypothetical protein
MFARQLLYGVLICREHCCAVYGLDKHLKQHHSMPAAKRRALLDSYKDFDVLLPAEVSLPLSHGPVCTLIRVEYFVRDRSYA